MYNRPDEDASGVYCWYTVVEKAILSGQPRAADSELLIWDFAHLHLDQLSKACKTANVI